MTRWRCVLICTVQRHVKEQYQLWKKVSHARGMTCWESQGVSVSWRLTKLTNTQAMWLTRLFDVASFTLFDQHAPLQERSSHIYEDKLPPTDKLLNSSENVHNWGNIRTQTWSERTWCNGKEKGSGAQSHPYHVTFCRQKIWCATELNVLLQVYFYNFTPSSS